MSAVRRGVESAAANVRSLGREPFTLAVLFALPVAAIQLYGVSLASMSGLGLFDTAASLETTGKVTGAVFAAGALAGILGLFQSLGVRNADHRLVTAGYRPRELYAARLLTVALAAVAVAAVTTAALDTLLAGRVESPGVVFLALLFVGTTYGLVGVLVGNVLPADLEGSLVLVVFADVEAVVASGLFGIESGVTDLLPMAHPHALAMEATVDGALLGAHVLPAVGHVGLLAALVAAAYARTLPGRGGRT